VARGLKEKWRSKSLVKRALQLYNAKLHFCSGFLGTEKLMSAPAAVAVTNDEGGSIRSRAPGSHLQSPAAGAPYPQQLSIDWTDYCNAKCFFCNRDKYEKQIGGKGEFIPFEKLRRLEKVLSSVKFFLISSGIGEPLLHPELEEILQWLYEINPKILLRTISNGTAFTASKAPWFAGHIDWISVSLNAANGKAHMRDMFPHLAERNVDAEKRWELHLRHLTEFIAALPIEDRPRVRFQMVTHRQNVQDMADFVRVVHSMGGSHAVFSNMAAHPETVDQSLFWVKDRYNDSVEEACDVGTRLGVRVDAARFYTSVKPVLDLDKVCRDPIDVAYISRSSTGTPCCQWAEGGIPTDVYSDDEGFDRYWNHDILYRLRQKRDFNSCRVCGMSRVFDETSFHFSPTLKRTLIDTGRLSDVESGSDYPDASLVRICIENRLDLPGIRRTLSRLGVPVKVADQIQERGLDALPEIDKACWAAFKNAETPMDLDTIRLGMPILGIGWGPPIYEPQNKVSARWVSSAQIASIFVRVTPGSCYAVSFTVHHCHELESRLQLFVGDSQIESWRSRDTSGRLVLSSIVPEHMTLAEDGRLRLQIGCLEANNARPSGHFSLIQLELSQLGPAITEFLRQSGMGATPAPPIIDDEYKLQLQALYASRSWRITAPLRELARWIRRLRVL
jgi:MoaA/NifB/PqqE/SkfB family radical SAM enzyme